MATLSGHRSTSTRIGFMDISYDEPMSLRRLPIDSLLTFVQKAVAQHQTNPYQITKHTGIPLRSVQKLLKQKTNPTLSNIDRIIAGLGYSLFAELSRVAKIPPGQRKITASPCLATAVVTVAQVRRSGSRSSASR